MDRLTVSVREASEALGLSVDTIRALIAAGRLPAVRVSPSKNGQLLVSKQGLLDFANGRVA